LLAAHSEWGDQFLVGKDRKEKIGWKSAELGNRKIRGRDVESQGLCIIKNWDK